MHDSAMMKKILVLGLEGAGLEFKKGYKSALSVVYGALAQGIRKDQLMDGLEDYFGVGKTEKITDNILWN